MTEEANVVVPTDPSSPESAPPSREELAAAIWEKHSAPITKEDVRGDRPEPEQPTIPDRELVAPKIAELLAEKKAPEPNPLEERLARIEAALTKAPEPEPVDVTSQVEELRNLLLSEREEKARLAAEAEENETWNTLREGVVANIRAEAEEFPALVALGQEENVYHTVRAALQEGRSVSEYEVASEAEGKLRAVYDKLHAAFNPTNQESREQPTSSEAVDTPPTTLTPTLSSGDEALDIESLLAAGVDRREAAKRVWESKEKA